MKYHKNYDYFINFLSETFPDIPKIEIVYRNFDILLAIIENKNSCCAEEISYEVDLTEQRIRVKLRELENEEILTCKKEKKPNNSYKKKYYSSVLGKDFIEKFKKYLSCSICGGKLGKFGGIIHSNISLRENRIFCTAKCRNEWCDSVKRD